MRVKAFLLFVAIFLGFGFAPAQTAVSIHDIMVAGNNPVIGTAATKTLPYSPYYGINVSVTGIVVGVESTGDYTGTVYISEPSANWDSLVLTAEGMPVFNMATVNSACAVVGANVTVVGTVVLSTAVVPGDITAAGTPGTGILPTSCTTTSTGTMTQSIGLGTTLNSFGGALEYTGMTTSATFYAVAPTTGTTNGTTGAVTSTGQFWATLSSNTATNNHLFRSAGIAKDEYVPTGSTAPTWAGNPQRILIDTTTFGGTPVNITVGQTISCVTGSNIKVGATAGIGLIDYTLGYARLLIFPTSVCTVGGTVAGTTSAAADSTHFKVGTLDLNGFASTDPTFSTRLTKAASAIVTNLGAPDILALQEVSDLATLQTLATAVNTLGSTAYTPYLVAGSGATNVGFLVKPTLTVDSVTQVGASSTYTTSAGATANLWDSPPLVLKAEFVRVGKNYPVTVISPLFTLRDNSGDATLGPDIRLRRAAQASAISQMVQGYQTAGQNVVVAGNLNAFEFSDGYVDVTGIIDGSPATAVSTYQATSTTAALTDFNTQVTATSRYNFIERGDAVTYEHILASATIPDPNTAAASLASYATTVTQPHFTTDFYATNASSTTTPAGLTPHDGFVVAFLIPPVPTTASVTPTSINFGSLDIGASTSETATVTNTTTFASTVNIKGLVITGANAGDFGYSSNCNALAQNATCTISINFTPTAVGARSATLTITDDSTSDPTLVVTLAGTGLDTTATLSPSQATFASTDIGAASPALLFTYTNTSQIAETVSGASVSGDYSITANTCTASIAASGICTISVVFVPTAAGVRPGVLTVKDSSTGNPVLTSALSGTGLDTTATIAALMATFPATDLGATSPTQTFTVTNTSTVAITLTKIALTGDFAQTATTCSTTATLAAGASCTVTVDFMPTAIGMRSGALVVTNTSTGNPTLTATLTGTGLDTTATLTPASATFPSTSVGATSAATTFVVTNTSTIAISLKTIAVNGNFTETGTTCSLTATLPAGNSCTISVDFVPTTVGTLLGTLVVTNSTTGTPTLTGTLTGTSLPTTATLTPASADFGSIYAGGGISAAKLFTLTNTSAVAITFKGASVAGNFADTTACPATLAAGASCTISVIFAPLTSGALTGTLTVLTNTSANPTLTATLTGTGIPTTATLTPGSAVYVNTIVGNTSAAATFLWTNTSAIPLTVTKVATSTGFTVASTTCTGAVAAGASCQINVLFTPTALGASTGTLVVSSSASANPMLSSTLSGRGVADVEANVSLLNFGNVDIGYKGTPQTFLITNYTNAAIAFTGFTISGDFAYTTTCGSVIGALGTCTVTVNFTPTAIGTRTGAFTINTNDTKYPTIIVALTGNGVDFSIAVLPTSGTVIGGLTVDAVATVTPLGGFNSTLTMTCTSVASGSVCHPDDTLLAMTGTAASPDHLYITTLSEYQVFGYGAIGRTGNLLLTLFSLLSAGVLVFRFGRRRVLLPRLLASVFLLAALAMSNLGCSGKLPDMNAGYTVPGTYAYTITATDGFLTHTATYTLKVILKD